jgi:hypothetical protein
VRELSRELSHDQFVQESHVSEGPACLYLAAAACVAWRGDGIIRPSNELINIHLHGAVALPRADRSLASRQQLCDKALNVDAHAGAATALRLRGCRVVNRVKGFRV